MIVQGPAVISWVAQRNQASFTPDAVGIGQVTGDKLIAGVVYDNYNGNNVVGAITVAEQPTRKFWWGIFSYAFDTLGCSRITAYIDGDNDKSLKLIERLSFEQEGVLVGAGAEGQNILVYRLRKEDCKMLNWRLSHVQKDQDAASA